MALRSSSDPRMGGYLPYSACASRSLSTMKAGMVSRGSPSVRSIGRAWPGGMPSNSRRSRVNGDRIAPEASAVRPVVVCSMAGG